MMMVLHTVYTQVNASQGCNSGETVERVEVQTRNLGSGSMYRALYIFAINQTAAIIYCNIPLHGFHYSAQVNMSPYNYSEHHHTCI